MKRISILLLIFCTCFVLAAWPQAPKIITFDPPGSTGTFPVSISDTGWITGQWFDVNGVSHSFVRDPEGTLTSFDVPVSGTVGSQGCEVNSRGEVAGCFWDANGTSTGYRRTPDGEIIPIYVPGAGTGPNQGSMAMALNDAGWIAGQDTISASLQYSLLVAPDGRQIIFNPPGATWSWAGMESAINPAGALIGGYVDSNEVYHAYVRARKGTITNFDAPSSGQGAGEGTFPMGISPNGTIVGFVQDNNELTHGFVRTPDGRFKTFDVPGAGTIVDSWEGTFAYDINAEGTIIGWYADANWVVHGFLKSSDGRITTFDGPNASTTQGQGTYPMTINSEGAITGYYYDSEGMAHGFLGLRPHR